MKVIECRQGSSTWFENRAGKVTASDVVNVLAFLKRGDKKGGDTAARAAYKAQLVSEILTHEPSMEGYLNSFMSWGIENEPFARAAYEIRTDQSVDTVGLVLHPTIERAAASPDGLVGADGLVEIKCPKTETHIGYMIAGVVPEQYEPQMMFQMACTGRAWCDFCSFDGRLPLRHQLFIKRLPRDEARIAEIDAAVLQFLGEVDEMIAQMEKLNPPVDVPVKPKFDIESEMGVTDEDIAAWYKSTGAQQEAQS